MTSALLELGRSRGPPFTKKRRLFWFRINIRNNGFYWFVVCLRNQGAALPEPPVNDEWFNTNNLKLGKIWVPSVE